MDPAITRRRDQVDGHRGWSRVGSSTHRRVGALFLAWRSL